MSISSIFAFASTYCMILFCQLASITTCLLVLTALIFTYIFRVPQIRAIPRFWHLLRHGLQHMHTNSTHMISPLQALINAMSTSIGIGTIIGPSIAIIIGGPGALAWLLLYGLVGCVLKFVEVTLALQFRKKTAHGDVLGGPTQYLTAIHPWLGAWYAYGTIILFTSWSSVQSNVLADVLAQEAVPPALTGFLTALLVYVMLNGGARRIAEFNIKLIPFMSVFYMGSAWYILWANSHALPTIIADIFYYSIHPISAFGAFCGATLMQTVQAGIYKGVYITESGMGTAAIPHSMANTHHPSNQGVLAMISTFADTTICMLSGLMILTTNHWQTATITNTLMYKTFQENMPMFGRPILVITILLFAIGTIIGNSFNGRQTFAIVTRYRFLNVYALCVCATIFAGALIDVPVVWQTVDFLLPLIAIPHVFSLLYWALKKRELFVITTRS